SSLVAAGCLIFFCSQLRGEETASTAAADQISGTVSNEDGQAIEGAAVSDLWSRSKTTSDKAGHFLLKKVEKDPKPIVCVKKSGYAQLVTQQDAGSADVKVTLSNR